MPLIPAHVTELSPDEVRGFHPGVTYQLGSEARGIAFGGDAASEAAAEDDRAGRFARGEDARLQPADRARSS